VYSLAYSGFITDGIKKEVKIKTNQSDNHWRVA